VGTEYGNKSIVTSGLTLCLDAGNLKSYPTTGTTWTDLSNNGNTAGLVSTTYQSINNVGHLSFNGSTSYGATSFVSSTSNNFTMDVWCRPTNTIAVYNQTTFGFNPPFLSGHRFVLAPDNRGTSSGAGISVGTNGINVIEHGNTFFPAPLTYYTTISNTRFTNITVVYISKVPYLYINGVFIKTGLTTSSPTTFLSLGTQGIGTLYGFYQGDISMIKCYTRSLSASEVLQNYNATKWRFQ
jgi:hypothetical protein